MAETKRSRRVKPVPVFPSREAEAQFWDTHDLTDYAAFDAPVPFGPLARRSEQVTLYVDPETLDLVKAMAAEQDLPWDALLGIWLVERRDAEQAKRRAEANERQWESA
jgi:hypothetical protein